jgi:hypothetical protein
MKRKRKKLPKAKLWKRLLLKAKAKKANILLLSFR